MTTLVTIIASLFIGLTASAQQATGETKPFIISQAKSGVSAGEYLQRRIGELQLVMNEQAIDTQGRSVCFQLGLVVNATEVFVRHGMAVAILSESGDSTKKLMYRINRFGDAGNMCSKSEPLDLESLRKRIEQQLQDLNEVLQELNSVAFKSGVPGEGWPK